MNRKLWALAYPTHNEMVVRGPVRVLLIASSGLKGARSLAPREYVDYMLDSETD